MLSDILETKRPKTRFGWNFELDFVTILPFFISIWVIQKKKKNLQIVEVKNARQMRCLLRHVFHFIVVMFFSPPMDKTGNFSRKMITLN